MQVFHERVKVFQNWQHSQFQLTKKRETKAKLELSGRNDKLDQAGVEVLEVSIISSLFKNNKNMYFFEVYIL